MVGDLVIDPRGHTASVAGRLVELTSREFDLLHALALEAGMVLSIDDLIARVWGAEFSGEPQGRLRACSLAAREDRRKPGNTAAHRQYPRQRGINWWRRTQTKVCKLAIQ